MQPAFDSVSAFIQMGGAHAPFIWSAWGISVLCLLVLVWHARAVRRQFFREELARQRRQNAQTSATSSQKPSSSS